MRTTRTSSQAAFNVSEIPLMSPELLCWLGSGMRGQMPARVYAHEGATSLHHRTPADVESHRDLEAAMREVGAERLLLLNELVAGSRGQAPRPETVAQPATPYPPIPRFPARPRPPHVALNIEPNRPVPVPVHAPAPAPTFLQSYQPMVATTPGPEQEPCCTRAKIVPAVTIAAAAGVGIATYYAYKKIYYG
jgi:hypothetical protein